jgi:hypothetical protein
MAQLASLIACQALREYRVMLGAALTVGVTPVEVKEIVYPAVPHVGMAKVFDFLHATNEVLTERGVPLPLEGQSTTTPETRAQRGLAGQKELRRARAHRRDPEQRRLRPLRRRRGALRRADRPHDRHEPGRAVPADPFRAPAAARPGWRADHPTVVLRRAGRVPGQLDVPRHEVGHRELDQEPAPVRMVLGSSALDNTLSVLKERIARFEGQTELAASTDFPSGV